MKKLYAMKHCMDVVKGAEQFRNDSDKWCSGTKYLLAVMGLECSVVGSATHKSKIGQQRTRIIRRTSKIAPASRRRLASNFTGDVGVSTARGYLQRTGRKSLPTCRSSSATTSACNPRKFGNLCKLKTAVCPLWMFQISFDKFPYIWLLKTLRSCNWQMVWTWMSWRYVYKAFSINLQS